MEIEQKSVFDKQTIKTRRHTNTLIQDVRRIIHDEDRRKQTQDEMRRG